MILVDANLLLYAVNADAPQHAIARSWLEKTLSSEDVGLAWPVMLAFLRVSSHPRIYQHPLSPTAALAYLQGWLALPNVREVQPSRSHWRIFSAFVERLGLAGNLTTDAYLAALAIDQGCILCSADNDFRMFEGLRYENPFLSA